MIIEVEVSEGINVSPGLFGNSDWQKVVVCNDCKYTIRAEDINFHEPCPNCGGEFNGMLSFVGKWDLFKRVWLKRKQVKGSSANKGSLIDV